MQFTLNYIYIYIFIYLSASQKGYGSTWMQEAVREAYSDTVKGSGPDAEFNAYLNSAPQTTKDVVRVCHLFIMSPFSESTFR